MSMTLKKWGLTVLMLLAPTLLFAQTNPCGDNPFDPSPCDLPLDSYVLILVFFAFVFGVKQLIKTQNLN